MSARTAHELYCQLKGVFAVYKHSGRGIQSLQNIIAQKIASGLNSAEQQPQKPMVRYVPRSTTEGSLSTEAQRIPGANMSIADKNSSLFDRVPINVTDWFEHPLVQGPRYNIEDIELHAGHALDWASSGIQLFGLQTKGKRLLDEMGRLRLPRSYLLRGVFGKASTKFDGESKIMDKTTWDHISEAKIIRLLTMLQGTYRNALIKSSNIDLHTQHAYEMASKGLLRPTLPTGPMVLELKLEELDLPNFVIDVTCIQENSTYLRKLIHNIGIGLKSSAVCMSIHRYRDAIFFVEDDSTLLTKDLTAEKVVDIASQNSVNLYPILRSKPSIFQAMNNQYSTNEDDASRNERENVDGKQSTEGG